MSLDYRLNKIENYQELLNDKGQPRPRTEALIFATMSIGIGQITEANAQEFYERVYIVETVHGAFLKNDKGDMPITLEDVKRHVGLWTNVFPKVAKAKFLANLGKTALERLIDARKHRESPPTGQ